MKLARIGLTASLFALALSGCKQQPAATPPATVDSPKWAQFTDQYLDSYFKHNPSFAAYQGRHEFDGKLPDWSKEGLQKQAEFLKNAADDAEEMDDGTLSKAQQFEKDYLIKMAQTQLFWLEDADEPHNNVTWYFDNGLDPGQYVSRPYGTPEQRMKAFTSYATAIPAALAQIKGNLKTPMPLSYIDYAIPGFKGYASYYTGDAKAAFASVKDPALQSAFDTATKAASAAMTDMAKWMEGQRATATQDFALGADKFSRMLQVTEGVDLPLEELKKIGQIDLERNKLALEEACKVFAPKTTVGGCMMQMNASKPKGGPVAEARLQLPDLKKFLTAQNIVTIPGTEEALVEESPPYNRQNSAYIDIPGPYEKGLPSVYYISPPDPAWSPEEQLGFIPGKKDLLFTSVHEVWPGHFLQFLHANRAKSKFGQVFYSYAFSEGWAHYSEEMMWDAGLNAGDEETRIGQLSNALLRNCRYLSAIGLHSGTMTQEQSRQLFVQQCHQDEGNAKQQSARGTYDPAYINYTLGKLLIRKLRDDWSAERGGRKAWKAFHDEFLSYGSPPIPLVRGAMMGGEAKAVF